MSSATSNSKCRTSCDQSPALMRVLHLIVAVWNSLSVDRGISEWGSSLSETMLSDTRGGGISFLGMIFIPGGNGYNSSKASKRSPIQGSKAPSILKYVSNVGYIYEFVCSSPKSMLFVSFSPRADLHSTQTLHSPIQELARPAKFLIRCIAQTKACKREILEQIRGEIGAEQLLPERSHRPRFSARAKGRNNKDDCGF